MTSPSLKAYVGQTSNSIEQRHWVYKHPETMRGQRKLKRALLKYGYDAFTVEAFEVPRSDLSLIEVLIIAQEDSFENGYNATEGGETGHQKLDSELKYKVRQSEDPRGYRKAVLISKYAHFDESFPILFSAITEEPTMVKEIANKAGMRGLQAARILNRAIDMGVPIKRIETRDDRGRVRPAYYFPSVEENKHERCMKAGKLTKAECPTKMRGNSISDEELRERAKGTGWRATDARRTLKMRAEKRAHEC